MSDRIVSHPSTDAYRAGYDAIYGKRDEQSSEPPTAHEQEDGPGAGEKSSD